jgi:hypothetical protein
MGYSGSANVPESTGNNGEYSGMILATDISAAMEC